MNAYFKLRNEITVFKENDLLVKGTRIILPTSLRSHALSLAHEGHQGLVKTKRLLREKVWFPAKRESLVPKINDRKVHTMSSSDTHQTSRTSANDETTRWTVAETFS
jgi:hypothetical protein